VSCVCLCVCGRVAAGVGLGFGSRWTWRVCLVECVIHIAAKIQVALPPSTHGVLGEPLRQQPQFRIVNFQGFGVEGVKVEVLAYHAVPTGTEANR